jgi:hypothetical protein
MPDLEAPPFRPWKDIARELSQTMDYDKMMELAQELNRAMEAQSQKPDLADESK